MTDTFTEDDLGTDEGIIDPDDTGDDYPEDVPGKPGDVDLSLFDSPDFADFIKTPTTANAKAYEKRVASLLKTIAFSRMTTPGGVADGATLIYHGGNFSKAMGRLADTDKTVARGIDIITSPENAYVAAVLVTLPMVAQLMRNHETQLDALPGKVRKTRAQRKAERAANPKARAEITIPILKKKVRVYIPFKLNFGAFRSQSVEPSLLVTKVFSDDKVRRELRKQGIRIGE